MSSNYNALGLTSNSTHYKMNLLVDQDRIEVRDDFFFQSRSKSFKTYKYTEGAQAQLNRANDPKNYYYRIEMWQGQHKTIT